MRLNNIDYVLNCNHDTVNNKLNDKGKRETYSWQKLDYKHESCPMI